MLTHALPVSALQGKFEASAQIDGIVGMAPVRAAPRARGHSTLFVGLGWGARRSLLTVVQALTPLVPRSSPVGLCV